MTTPCSRLAAVDPELKRSLKTMAVGTVVFLGLFIAIAIPFRDELQAFGNRVVDVLGYTGLGLGIMSSDMLTLPIPPDFYLLVAVTAQLDPMLTIIAGSIGSICGGIGAFFLGRLLGTTSFVERLVEPFQERGTRLIERYGVAAVIFAALTPIPFSIVCTLTGMMGMSLGSFLPATLFRIPRIAGYYYAIQIGWISSGG